MESPVCQQDNQFVFTHHMKSLSFETELPHVSHYLTVCLKLLFHMGASLDAGNSVNQTVIFQNTKKQIF